MPLGRCWMRPMRWAMRTCSSSVSWLARRLSPGVGWYTGTGCVRSWKGKKRRRPASSLKQVLSEGGLYIYWRRSPAKDDVPPTELLSQQQNQSRVTLRDTKSLNSEMDCGKFSKMLQSTLKNYAQVHRCCFKSNSKYWFNLGSSLFTALCMKLPDK